MSFDAMRWAIAQRTGSAKAKAVLLTLANYADRLGQNCYPGQKLIAEITELSEDSVQRGLKELEANGFIRREKRPSKGGRWSGNCYSINMPSDLGRAVNKRPIRTQDHTAVCGIPSGRQTADCDVTKPQTGHSPHRRLRQDSIKESINEPSRSLMLTDGGAFGILGMELRRRIGVLEFDAWFRGATLVEFGNETVTIALRDAYCRSRVEENYKQQVLECCQRERPSISQVKFVVDLATCFPSRNQAKLARKS